MTGPHLLADRRMTLWIGIIMLCGGSYLLYDAYEGRGRPRPFLTKFIPL